MVYAFDKFIESHAYTDSEKKRERNEMNDTEGILCAWCS